MAKPSKAFSTRLSEAKQWRSGVERDIKDALRFCSPGRERDFDKKGADKTEPIPEIFTSYAEEYFFYIDWEIL